jgi:hypothetical protein
LTATMITPVTSVSKKYIGLHINCLLFLSNFNQTWISLTDFSETSQYDI